MAQQLLSPAGGNLNVVIATQANLPVAWRKDSPQAFIANSSPKPVSAPAKPSPALARGPEHPLRDAWNIPICLARPGCCAADAAARARDHAARNTLPPTRDSFQPRPEIMAQIRAGLAAHRLVSLVGLPGIGRPNSAKECARDYGAAHPERRIVYQTINRGLAPVPCAA